MASRPTELPDSLRAQFAALERALWRKETTQAATATGILLLVSLLALFISDRFWDTPRTLRLFLTGGALAGGFWLLQRWATLWYWRRRDLRAFSKIVQKHHRRLGDRLLGIVELAEQTELPEGMSAALRAAAIKQVAEDAAKMDFTAAVDFQLVRKFLLMAGVVGVIMLLIAIISPNAAGNAAKRWLLPTADAPRYTFIEWDGLPTELVVPHGEPFDFSAEVKFKSFWHPSSAKIVLGLHEGQAAVENGHVRFELPPQTQSGQLRLRAGDAIAVIQVRPEHRPALRQLQAKLELPAYLQQPVQVESTLSGKLRVLKDTKVTLTGEATRSLKSATVQLDRNKPLPLVTQGNRFTSTALSLDDIQRGTLAWKDELGLTNRSPWLLGIESVIDAPPSVELTDLGMDVAILEDEVLRINTMARDDYGVRQLGLAWQIVAGPIVTNSPGSQVMQRQTTNTAQRQFAESFVFSPSVLNIPADTTVEIHAQATDYYPQRVPAESTRYRVHVIGQVKHAEMVRQQFEQMFAKMEEVTRKQEALANATRDLKNQSEEKLNTETAAAKAGEQAQQQEQTARQLQEIARSGTETLREAMRNSTFNEETLREWAKTLQSMQKLSKGEMKDASKSLQQAQQSPKERKEQLAQAQTSEEEAMRALEKMQQNMNQGLDRLQAQTLAQRLRQIAKDEIKVGEYLQTIIPETVGLMVAELPSRYLNTLNDLATSQAKARKDAQLVQDEMSRFYERTQRPAYGEVSKGMKEADTGNQLDKLRQTMLANISLQTMQGLDQWSKRFNDWADKLEPKPDPKSDGGGGEGGKGGNPQDNYLKLLMTFLRMREAQYNLIDRTRLLEQRKAQDEQYAANARKLVDAQFASRRQVIDTQLDNQLPELDKPLEDTFQTMRNTEGILVKPQTGQLAQDSELKVVENLSDIINLINEQQKKNNQQNQSQSNAEQEMAFMMQMVAQPQAGQQMMSMKPGSEPGMNQSGGTTDKANQMATGDGQSGRGPNRSTGNTTGTSQPLPAEFREALESYFKAIEKLDE